MKAFFVWLWNSGAYYLKTYIWHVVGLAIAHFTLRRMWARQTSMEEPEMGLLDQNGKIGDVGTYEVKVGDDIKLEADVTGAFQKDLIASIPGGLSVQIQLTGKVLADPVAIALAELANSSNTIVKFLVGELSKLRAGQDVHPAVVQAAKEAADAAAQPAPSA